MSRSRKIRLISFGLGFVSSLRRYKYTQSNTNYTSTKFIRIYVSPKLPIFIRRRLSY